MRTSLQRSWLLLALPFVLASAAAPVQAASTSGTNYSLPAVDPGTVAKNSNGYGYGSKLDANGKIVLQAPVASVLPGNPNPALSTTVAETPVQNLSSLITSNAVCYSIQNYSGNAYFVPWNTPKEWSAFLTAIGASAQLQWELTNNKPYSYPQQTLPAAGGWLNVTINTCCPPQEVGAVCPNGERPDIVSTAQLGYRYNDSALGTSLPQGNSYWGANGDVYTANASTIANNGAGDPSIDYTVTFECLNGTWQQTTSYGSCLPLNGQCAANAGSLTSIPSGCMGASTPAACSTLCAPGSIFGDFAPGSDPTAPTGPWSWTCDGTPGMANATCSTTASTAGCGSQAGQPYAGWGGTIYTWGTLPSANLCASGSTPSAVTGADKNTYSSATGTTYVPNLFHWTCTGSGGSTSTCTAPDSTGLCAETRTSPDGTSGPTAPNPATDFMCVDGTPSTPIYGLQAGNTGLTGWSWTCNNSSNPAWGQNCFKTDSNAPVPGACGNYDEISSSSTVPPTDLCLPGSTVGSGPTFINAAPNSYWTWNCVGNNGGSTQTCNEVFDANPPVCGPEQNVYFPQSTPPTTNLCTSGTAGVPYIGGSILSWQWSCTGSIGDIAWCSTPGFNSQSTSAQCGAAYNVTTSSAPTANSLCAATNTASAPSLIGTTWSWSCTGTDGSSLTCTAPYASGVQPPGPSCGTANGAPATSQPTTNLCGAGSTMVSISANNDGSGWSWTCQSGSATTPCSASVVTDAAGKCGTSDGADVPGAPNINLCQSGLETPNPVSVATLPEGSSTGPGWTWSCLGQGSFTGQDQSCSALFCMNTGSQVLSNVRSSTVTGTMNGCAVKVYATWTETDTVVQSNANVTMKWSDPFNGTFSQQIIPQPVPAPNPAVAPPYYCQPNWFAAQSISNAQIVVTATSPSSCTDPTLSSGNPVPYTPTGITLSPQY